MHIAGKENVVALTGGIVCALVAAAAVLLSVC
jgi:hypothetical protein